MLAWIALGGCGDARNTIGTLPPGFELGGAANDGPRGSGGAGRPAGNGDGDGDGDGDANGGTGGTQTPQACERTPAPVRMDISLVLDTYITLPLTTALQNALTGVREFVDDTRSVGTGVGLLVIRSACEPGFYATPDAVVDVLPDHAATIKQSLPDNAALSYTTMVPAVQAAADQARTRGRDHPERKQIIVLASQGIAFARAPCGFAEADLQQAAGDARGGTPSIPLYTIALGDASGIPLLPGSLLDMAAAAGGTGQARVVNLASQSMGEMLQAIRAEAQPCQYVIPGDIDPQNLRFFTNGTVEIPRVPDAASCAGVTAGYYYDDPASPGLIIACEQTCGRIRYAGHENVRVRGDCAP